MEIHQILPNIGRGDAIGNETLLIRDILHEWGHTSDIYAQNIQPGIDAFPYTNYKNKSAKDNILIYHYSIGSDITEFIEKLPDKIVILYHNQTPEKYFWGINDQVASLLHKGRQDMKKLSNIAKYGIGDSEFNCLELKESGFAKIEVLPLIFDFAKKKIINEEILKQYPDSWINILFVGRIAPNKRQDELIKIFYYYKNINPNSRLFLIGNFHGFEEYYKNLKEIIEQLSLPDVIMPGSVSDNDLNAYYSIADVFLCMSEHEGFCVPLVESMYFNVPIIANNSTAIPFTLGDSGVLINKKEYCEIAEFIDIIINDVNLKKKIIEKQQIRLKEFASDKTKEKLRKIIENIMKGEAG